MNSDSNLEEKVNTLLSFVYEFEEQLDTLEHDIDEMYVECNALGSNIKKVMTELTSVKSLLQTQPLKGENKK